MSVKNYHQCGSSQAWILYFIFATRKWETVFDENIWGCSISAFEHEIKFLGAGGKVVGVGVGAERHCAEVLWVLIYFLNVLDGFPPPKKEENKKLLCQDLARIQCVCTIIFQKKFLYAFSTIVPDMQMPVLLICIHNIHQTAVLLSAKKAC